MASDRSVDVHVHWLSAEEGVRTVALVKSRWPALSRFPEQHDHWPDGSWTVVVEFEPVTVGDVPTRGTARFLMPDAPHAWLYSGQRFGLYQGLRKVADVDVASE
ncbi:MAG TPA: hypothetical protein VNW46_11715 [Gemmatimonadaceae bacterium]|jgi:hypothetical protein|nr:hypothetical protein [Gemmatimonadaceae bacterium]